MDLVKCDGCNKLAEERLNTKYGTFHRDCFTCTACRKPFSGGSCVETDGKPYHDACAPKQSVSRAPQGSCAKCGGAFRDGKVVTAEGRQFHAACLVCHSCRAELGSQFYKSKTGHLLCDGCRNTEN